jgi:uncharacterized protein (DUF1697 family)
MIAFLCSINVGGHNITKMDALKKLFSGLGLKDVSYYKQSGNVMFNGNIAAKKIEGAIKKDFGKDVKVFVLDVVRIKEISKIKHPEESPSKKLYVTFFDKTKPIAPFSTQDIDIFLFKEDFAFSFALLRNGKFGNPNLAIEKAIKAPATTRNWNTINTVAAFSKD